MSWEHVHSAGRRFTNGLCWKMKINLYKKCPGYIQNNIITGSGKITEIYV